GDYSYTQGSATGPDDIKYTEIDGDGDISSADLSIQPYLPAPHAVDDHIFITSADPFIADSWLLNNDSPESGLKLLDVFDEQQVGIVQGADGLQLSVDSGHYFGSFDYTIETPSGATDSAFVAVDLVTDPTGHSIDQSAATTDVILVGDAFDNSLKGGSGDDVLV